MILPTMGVSVISAEENSEIYSSYYYYSVYYRIKKYENERLSTRIG